jgi:hypothetical protein
MAQRLPGPKGVRFGYVEVGPIYDLGNGGSAIPQLNRCELNRSTRAALPRTDLNAAHSPYFSLAEANCFRKKTGYKKKQCGSAVRHCLRLLWTFRLRSKRTSYPQILPTRLNKKVGIV